MNGLLVVRLFGGIADDSLALLPDGIEDELTVTDELTGECSVYHPLSLLERDASGNPCYGHCEECSEALMLSNVRRAMQSLGLPEGVRMIEQLAVQRNAAFRLEQFRSAPPTAYSPEYQTETPEVRKLRYEHRLLFKMLRSIVEYVDDPTESIGVMARAQAAVRIARRWVERIGKELKL